MKENSPMTQSLLGTYKPSCNGCVIYNTMGEKMVYFSLFFVAAPLLILLSFNIRNLMYQYHNVFYTYNTHWCLVIIIVIFTACAAYYLIRAWLTEPGIIPKTQTSVIIEKAIPNEDQRKVGSYMYYVKSNKKEYLQKTFEVFPESIDHTNIEGRTLLHVAALYDKEEITKVLLSFLPDLSIHDFFGLQAIHYAACIPNSKVFPLLCQFLNYPPSEWDVVRQQLQAEVYQTIPQYSFEKNCYYIEREGQIVEHADISAFFLPTPISELLQSDQEKIMVPFMYFVCLCRGHIINVMFCDACKNFTPPRGLHCRNCQICVRNFDHHCPWVSNCIGLRNHGYFVWFLIWAVLSCLFGVAVMSIYFVTYIISLLEGKDGFAFWKFLKETWACLLYGGCCIGFIAPLLNLLVYHIQITLRNETTHEELMLPSGLKLKEKLMNKEKYFPYNEGWKKNLKNALFSRNPKSLIVTV